MSQSETDQLGLFDRLPFWEGRAEWFREVLAMYADAGLPKTHPDVLRAQELLDGCMRCEHVPSESEIFATEHRRRLLSESSPHQDATPPLDADACPDAVKIFDADLFTAAPHTATPTEYQAYA